MSKKKENLSEVVANSTIDYLSTLSSALHEAKPRDPSNPDSPIYTARKMIEQNFRRTLLNYTTGCFIPTLVEEGNCTEEEAKEAISKLESSTQ